MHWLLMRRDLGKNYFVYEIFVPEKLPEHYHTAWFGMEKVKY